MSYIKIEKITKETVDTPEKGYIYFGFDDPTKGPWIKDDDGSEAFYILSGYDANPTIVNISPTSSAFNGDTITINGTNFIPSITSVRFDDKIGLDVNVLSVTQLTVIVPGGITGEVSIVVSTSYGTSLPVLYTVKYKNAAPVISSINPVIGSQVGSEITITGYNFVAGETIAWFGNGVSGSTTVSKSTELKSIIPEIPTGPTVIFLSNSNGQGNTFSYTITESTDPTFTSFSPSSGSAGDTITITGTNFAAGEISVYFGDTYASNITVDSDTQISADITSGTHIGDTRIKVGTTILDGFTVNGSTSGLLPTISSILPLSQTPGATLTVEGTNFDGDVTVTFSGIDVPVLTGKTSTSFQVVLTGNTSQNVIVNGVNSVIVTNKYGSSSRFEYIIPNSIYEPTITSFSPTSDYRENPVNLYGTNFIVGTGNAVFYGNVLGKMNGHTTELIRTEIPINAPTGEVDIKLVNANGSYIIPGFTVVPSVTPPTITGVSPIFAKAGDTINVYGTNLDDGEISFGYAYPGVSNTTLTMLSTQLQTTLPSGLVGAGDNKIINVYVTTTGGTYTYSPLEVYGTPITSPDIVSFEPLGGTVGTQVTLKGNFFTKYYTEASVYVNGTYYVLDSQEYISDAEIKGNIPDVGGYTGSVFIKVVTKAGTNQIAGFTIV